MAGNREGGLKTKQRIIERFGEGYWTRIGQIGGRAAYKGLKGFAANKPLARVAGRIGGLKSRRGKKLVTIAG